MEIKEMLKRNRKREENIKVIWIGEEDSSDDEEEVWRKCETIVIDLFLCFHRVTTTKCPLNLPMKIIWEWPPFVAERTLPRNKNNIFEKNRFLKKAKPSSTAIIETKIHFLFHVITCNTHCVVQLSRHCCRRSASTATDRAGCHRQFSLSYQ